MWNCWNKLVPLLLMFGYSFFVKEKLKMVVYATCAFLLLRFIWQIFELENYQLANKPYILDILFIVDIIVIMFIIIVPYINKFSSYKVKFTQWLKQKQH